MRCAKCTGQTCHSIPEDAVAPIIYEAIEHRANKFVHMRYYLSICSSCSEYVLVLVQQSPVNPLGMEVGNEQ